MAAYALIYVIIRYYSKKNVFDLQHFIVIKFVLSLEQSGLNIILMFSTFTNLFFAFATDHQKGLLYLLIAFYLHEDTALLS
jgi:hypothetical protein